MIGAQAGRINKNGRGGIRDVSTVRDSLFPDIAPRLQTKQFCTVLDGRAPQPFPVLTCTCRTTSPCCNGSSLLSNSIGFIAPASRMSTIGEKSCSWKSSLGNARGMIGVIFRKHLPVLELKSPEFLNDILGTFPAMLHIVSQPLLTGGSPPRQSKRPNPSASRVPPELCIK